MKEKSVDKGGFNRHQLASLEEMRKSLAGKIIRKVLECDFGLQIRFEDGSDCIIKLIRGKIVALPRTSGIHWKNMLGDGI